MVLDCKAEIVTTTNAPVILRTGDGVFQHVNAGPRVSWYTCLLMLICVALVLCTSACGGATPATSPSSSTPTSVVIAYQFGLDSASLLMIKQRRTLEKQFPHTNIQWNLFQSGAAVREAMIANQAQVGYVGIPPFLVGWDRGVNWRILTTVSRQDSWLVVKDSKIQSLKDFTQKDKIGLPAPDSVHAITLRKAAQEQLGNAHALDANLVAIPQADGVQALINGQIAGHFTSPPFEYQEVEAGGRVILKSFDVFGQVSTGGIIVLQSFYNQYPGFAKQLYQDIQDATAFVTSNHKQTAQYLSQELAGKISPDKFQVWLQKPSVIYNTTPSGLLNYAQFMYSIGLISKVPSSIAVLELPTLNGVGS